MEWFLALGFLIRMQHALEADHLAAVGAMAASAHASKRGLALRGAAWGLDTPRNLFGCYSKFTANKNGDLQTEGRLEKSLAESFFQQSFKDAGRAGGGTCDQLGSQFTSGTPSDAIASQT